MNTSRRRHITSIMIFVGLLALLVSTFTLPEALVMLGRASSDVGTEPLTTRGVVVTVVGFSTLLFGGLLTIVGVTLRRLTAPQHNPEDDQVAEYFEDDQLLQEYDPMDLNPHLRERERGTR